MYFGYDAERRKISKLKGKDNIWFGLFGQIVGAATIVSTSDNSHNAFNLRLVGELAFILSTGVLIGGCAMYARFHGLRRFWALLGLLNLPGVMMLALLPQRGKARARGAGFSVIFAEPYRRDVWRMDVSVKLDDSVGANVREPIMLQLPRGSRVGTAMKTLADVIPRLTDEDLPGVVYTVNGETVDRRAELSEGDELVVRIVGQTSGARASQSA